MENYETIFWSFVDWFDLGESNNLVWEWQSAPNFQNRKIFETVARVSRIFWSNNSNFKIATIVTGCSWNSDGISQTMIIICLLKSDVWILFWFLPMICYDELLNSIQWVQTINLLVLQKCKKMSVTLLFPSTQDQESHCDHLSPVTTMLPVAS